ncbi:MAG: hypothetical protein WEE50_07730 [Chloroflexota bacterium]
MERSDGSLPVMTRAGPSDRGPVAAVAVVATLIVVALLKPWPSDWTDTPLANVSPSHSNPSSPAAAPEARVALPTMALDPPATACYADSGWRVCMLGDSAGQEIQTWLFGTAARRSAATVGPTTPAVLVVTRGGAGLGLYAPRSSMERMTGQSVVSAWQIREGTGVTSWIALQHVASIGTYDVPAGAVYRPPPEGLGSADQWPTGRYLVRLQAATGGWERWFGMKVTSSEHASTRSDHR